MAGKRSLVRGGITLAVLAALAGAMLVAPAGAHVTGKFGHLKKHIKQISKKQANQVFNQNIGSASVANATNAANLGGEAPTTYLDRGAMVTATTSLGLTGTQTILGPVSITVPAGVKYVRSIGTVTVSGTAAAYAFWVSQDAVCALSGFGFDNRQFDNTTDGQTSTSQTLLWTVTPGAHTYRLCTVTGGTPTAFSRQLVVDTVARDSVGAPRATAASGGAAPDADNDPATAE